MIAASPMRHAENSTYRVKTRILLIFDKKSLGEGN